MRASKKACWARLTLMLGVLSAPIGAAFATESRVPNRDVHECSTTRHTGTEGDEPPPCPINPACITYRTESRARATYDHLVHISNGCDAVAECIVSTDVNPASMKVVVVPGTTQTVVTASGAQANEFTATVECSLRC